MRVVNLSKSGITQAKACRVRGHSGNNYYCYTHGMYERNRWEIRIPLDRSDFPCEELDESYDYGMRTVNDTIFNNSFELVGTDKKDPMGNKNFFLRKKEQHDNNYLLFWSLSPGYRGGATYNVTGDASIISKGKEGEGLAGNMSSADCPIVLVTGPTVLTWKRQGRLYGEHEDWIAEFNGSKWIVAPEHEYQLEELV